MFRIDHDLSPGGIRITIARVENTYRVVDHVVTGTPNDLAAAYEMVALMIYAVQGKLDIVQVHSNELLPFLMILAWCGHDATFDALLRRNSIHANIPAFSAWAVEKKLTGYATVHTYALIRCFGNLHVKFTLLAYRNMYWHTTTTTATGHVTASDRNNAQKFIDEVSSYVYGFTSRTGFSFHINSFNANHENGVFASISAFKGDIPALKSFHASYVVEALSAAHDPKTIEFIKSVQASAATQPAKPDTPHTGTFAIRPFKGYANATKPVQPEVVGFSVAAFAPPAEPIVVDEPAMPEPTIPEPTQKKSRV